MDNDVVKKNLYDKLVTKVNATDTKISSTNGLVQRSWVKNWSCLQSDTYL